MKRLLYLAGLLLLLFLQAAGALEIVFLDVGQGTGVAIITDEKRAVVYDGGPPGTDVAGQLRELGVEEVALVIASHGHADHIGGLPGVIEEFQPDFYMDNGLPHTTLAYERTLRAVQETGTRLLEPVLRTLTFDGVTLTVIPPPGIAAYGQNDNSIGLRIDHGTFSAVLPGDAERAEWEWWLRNHEDLFTGVDVFLASHHGSRNGDIAEGLAAMSPSVVVISLGEDNVYGHPHRAAFELYADADVMRTDEQGRITVSVNRDDGYTVVSERAGSAAALLVTDDAEYCVDLNTADLEELQRIIHIGPARALAVIEWRPFTRVEELGRINGIGKTRLVDVLEQGKACVSPPAGEEIPSLP